MGQRSFAAAKDVRIKWYVEECAWDMGLGGGGVNRQQHHDNDDGGVIDKYGRLGRAKNVRTENNHLSSTAMT
jgi:hypothetical protein